MEGNITHLVLGTQSVTQTPFPGCSLEHHFWLDSLTLCLER